MGAKQAEKHNTPTAAQKTQILLKDMLLAASNPHALPRVIAVSSVTFAKQGRANFSDYLIKWSFNAFQHSPWKNILLTAYPQKKKKKDPNTTSMKKETLSVWP